MGTAIVLKLDGKTDAMRHVERLEYAEALDQLDALVVEIVIPNNADGEKLLPTLLPGKPFVVELHEDGAMKESGAGDIVEVQHIRTTRGGYRVVLVGLDGLHRLHGTQPAQIWEVGHKDIVTKIAQRNGLTAKADGVDTTATIVLQGDGTDGLFLKQLARENNYFVRVVGKELHFKRHKAAGAKVEITWGQAVHEIRQRASLEGLLTGVMVHGYDPEQEKAITGEAKPADVQKISGGDVGVDLAKKAFGDIKLVLNQAGYVAPGNAKARAIAELQARAERFIQGTCVVDGHPTALSGRKLTVKEAGWPLSGDFLIRQTRHVLEGGRGYRTHIDFVSDSYPKKA